MKTRRVLSFASLPVRPPTTLTVVVWLLLDRLQAPGWLWGVAVTLLAILWLGLLYEHFTQEQVTLEELERK